MKKKILSVILTLAMIVTMLTGCQPKDSTYFEEVKELGQISTGNVAIEMDFTYSAEEAIEILKDENGNQSIKIKYEAVCESDKKVGMKISLKLGKEEYSELTTIVIDEKTLYMTVAPLIDTLNKIEDGMGTEIQTTLAQLGIENAISLNIEQLLEAMGTEMPEVTEENEKAAEEFVKAFFTALEKDFAVLQGKDGEDYTLSFNGENADKALDAVSKFLTEDAEKLIDQYDKLVDSVYGTDNGYTSQIKTMTAEFKAGIPDALEAIKSNKEEVVKEIKDADINIVSKANTTGKDGSREAKLSIKTGDIVLSETEKGNISITANIKEGTPTVKEMMPENALDVTTLLITMLNQATAGEDMVDMQ